MPHTVKQFQQGCRRLEREGFIRTDEQWSDISTDEFEIARSLHPNGSYALYKRLRKTEKV